MDNMDIHRQHAADGCLCLSGYKWQRHSLFMGQPFILSGYLTRGIHGPVDIPEGNF